MLELPTDPTVLWVLAALAIGMIAVALAQTKLLASSYTQIRELVKLVRQNGFQNHDRATLVKMELESSRAETLLAEIRDDTRKVRDATQKTSRIMGEHREEFREHVMDFKCIAREDVPHKSEEEGDG